MQYVLTEILPTSSNYKLYAQGLQEHHWIMIFENVLRLLIINVSVSIGFLFFKKPTLLLPHILTILKTNLLASLFVLITNTII